MNRQTRLETLINNELKPERLIVENESHMHSVPKDSETHFKLIIVAEAFSTLSRIQRHRLVNTLAAAELNSGLHALSLHLYTPEEWIKVQPDTLTSPTCKGGNKK